MPTTSLDHLVDLHRYPIDDLDGPGGTTLVAGVRESLRKVGACDLREFLLPEAVTEAVSGALAVQGGSFRTETTHNVEFSGRPPESLAPDDPMRLVVRSAKDGLAYDRVPDDSPVRALYESDEMLRFVAAALEVEPLYRSDDPLGALNLMYYLPGDELGWHFDNADFVVTLMLQAPEAGGVFEFVPALRSEGDRNDAGVRALLAGEHDDVRTMSGAPGTLALFRGHLSPHRVSPVVGSRQRINAVLSYARTPGHRLSPETYRIFYGRAPSAVGS